MKGCFPIERTVIRYWPPPSLKKIVKRPLSLVVWRLVTSVSMLNGQPAVSVAIRKQSGVNTVALASALLEAQVRNEHRVRT